MYCAQKPIHINLQTNETPALVQNNRNPLSGTRSRRSPIVIAGMVQWREQLHQISVAWVRLSDLAFQLAAFAGFIRVIKTTRYFASQKPSFLPLEKKIYSLKHHILINGTEGCAAQFYSTKRFSFIQERASKVEDAHCCYLGVKTSWNSIMKMLLYA